VSSSAASASSAAAAAIVEGSPAAAGELLLSGLGLPVAAAAAAMRLWKHCLLLLMEGGYMKLHWCPVCWIAAGEGTAAGLLLLVFACTTTAALWLVWLWAGVGALQLLLALACNTHELNCIAPAGWIDRLCEMFC
jgi:hypothetical protein